LANERSGTHGIRSQSLEVESITESEVLMCWSKDTGVQLIDKTLISWVVERWMSVVVDSREEVAECEQMRVRSAASSGLGAKSKSPASENNRMLPSS
jgi:hypothetical protein